jgi:hypothetical protein
MRPAEQPTNTQRNQCGRKGLFSNELSCHIANGTDNSEAFS